MSWLLGLSLWQDGVSASLFATSTAAEVPEEVFDCFLCGRGPTLSNPVVAGNMVDLRESWMKVGDLYRRLAHQMLCAHAAANHTHCRTYLRSLQQTVNDGEDRLDAMARCYTVAQLVAFLEVPDTPKSHRRCRGGLLSLFRMLESLQPQLAARVSFSAGRDTTVDLHACAVCVCVHVRACGRAYACIRRSWCCPRFAANLLACLVRVPTHVTVHARGLVALYSHCG